MVKLLTIIKKNFKILIRSKSSALIILLGPLLLILLVGSAFNTSTFSEINIGAHSEGYNDFTNSILTNLESDNYRVTKIETLEKCIDGVKSSTVHICAVFPPNLSVETPTPIEFYVDQSRENLVFAIRGAITSKISERSQELSEGLTGIVVSQLSQTQTELNNERTTIDNIRSQNNKLRSGLVDIESSLITMNVNFSEMNLIIDEINNETNKIKNDLNKSHKFELFDNLMKALKTEVKSFNDVSDERDKLTTRAGSLKTDISSLNADLQSVRDSTDSIISRIGAIEVTDVESIVSPIKTVTKPVAREETRINFLFPTLIMMVVMFVSVLLSSITVIREKISAAYFRNYISPTSSAIFIVSTYLTNILIIILQLVIVFGVMISINPGLSGVLANVSIALLIITTTFILLGMIVGYVFSSEETATVGSISISTLLLFFSNTIVPLETLPAGFRQMANLNIFVVGESALRKIILFDSTLKGIANELKILAIYIVVFVLIIIILYRVSSEIYNIKKHLKGK